ncbi:ornithine cyclodeaminase family protein [candidate division KSB1 bacterium]
MKIRILSAKDVRSCLPISRAVEVVKEAFIQLTLDKVEAPQRIHLDLPDNNAGLLFMPVYTPENRKIGFKMISLFGDNPKKNLPMIHALMMVVDAETGLPQAIMDGASLTAIRTGAASGAASDLLSGKDSRTAAVFGAGPQGETQLEAVCAVRKIEKAYIFDPDRKISDNFVEKMSSKLGISVLSEENEEVLRDVDIICTATNSKTPVFRNENITEGTHINAVGSYKPDVREIPSETVLRSKVYVDHKLSCKTEAGDILIPLKEGLITEQHILGELGELALGKISGRSDLKEITFFKSVGNAAQDIYAASSVLIEAEKEGLGVKVDI